MRYHASELSQGVTAAILAWPPPGAAAAFSTRLGQAGTAPGSFRRLSYNRRSASLEAEAGLEWNTDNKQLAHTRCTRARVRGPGSAAPSQMGLRFTASAGAMLHC